MSLPFLPAPRPPFSAVPLSLSGRLVSRFRSHPAEEREKGERSKAERAAAPKVGSEAAVIAVPKAAKLGFSGRVQAGIAEFLLITRLRARHPVNESVHSADVIASGAKIVQLTCQHWFGPTTAERRPPTAYQTRL